MHRLDETAGSPIPVRLQSDPSVSPAPRAGPAHPPAGVARDLARITGCFLVLGAVYWIAVRAVVGAAPFAGFPLDDAYIHLQFARNLFERGEMSFNPGIPSSGCTAPAFPFLLAAAYALVRDWYAAAHLVCALASLGSAWAVYAILRSWTGRADLARWGGILTVVASPTVVQAFGGMEAPVFSLVLLLGLWAYAGRSRAARWGGAACLGLCIWFRPEAILLLPLILLERLIAARRRRDRTAAALAAAVPILAVWLLHLAAYAAYHRHQDGHLVPTTFGAKALTSIDPKPAWFDGLPAAIKRGSWPQALLATGVWPLINLFLVGVGLGTICLPLAFGMAPSLSALWRANDTPAPGWRLAILILIGYPFLRAVVDPPAVIWFQNQRYFPHLTPLFILIALGAFPRIGAVVRKTWWDWRGLPLLAQQRRTIGWAFAGSLTMGAVAVLSVGNINDMQVRMARWLEDHTGEDELIATNDIGAIGFITRRPVLDTIGLIEPAIVDHYLSGGTIESYLTRRDPAYVVIFPNWYEAFSRRGDLLMREHAIKLDFNVVCGGSELVAYRPRWPAAGRPANRPVQ